MTYTFTHSIDCPVEREFAWGFWSEFENWGAVDPEVESVSLDGPFAAGTRGGELVEWRFAEVSEEHGAVVEVSLPGASMKFALTFEELGEGVTRITRRVTLEGERADDYAEAMKLVEQSMHEGMRRSRKR